MIHIAHVEVVPCLTSAALSLLQAAEGAGAGDSETDDLELGQRIASKLSGSKHGPTVEPAMWINSSLYVDRRA